MLKGIIFDLDGTLLDTLSDINNALNHILVKYGFPKKDKKHTRKNLGHGSIYLLRNSIDQNLKEEEFQKIHQDYVNYYQANNDILTKPYDGVIDLLKKLKELGYTLAVVSNKDDITVKSLNESKFLGLIDIAIGARHDKPKKPDPYLVGLALSKLNLKKEEAVYIGDSDVDILTARNSGLDMIAVTWGFRDLDVLEKNNAKNIVTNAKELLAKIMELGD